MFEANKYKKDYRLTIKAQTTLKYTYHSHCNRNHIVLGSSSSRFYKPIKITFKMQNQIPKFGIVFFPTTLKMSWNFWLVLPMHHCANILHSSTLKKRLPYSHIFIYNVAFQLYFLYFFEFFIHLNCCYLYI